QICVLGSHVYHSVNHRRRRVDSARRVLPIYNEASHCGGVQNEFIRVVSRQARVRVKLRPVNERSRRNCAARRVRGGKGSPLCNEGRANDQEQPQAARGSYLHDSSLSMILSHNQSSGGSLSGKLLPWGVISRQPRSMTASSAGIKGNL